MAKKSNSMGDNPPLRNPKLTIQEHIPPSITVTTSIPAITVFPRRFKITPTHSINILMVRGIIRRGSDETKKLGMLMRNSRRNTRLMNFPFRIRTLPDALNEAEGAAIAYHQPKMRSRTVCRDEDVGISQ